MSDGQTWANEMQHFTPDYNISEDDRRNRGLDTLADEIQSQAHKVRALAHYAPGCGVPSIVLQLQEIAGELRGWKQEAVAKT